MDYFLGWWLGRTRVTAVLSPVVALARQTGGYWGKRRGTSFFKYICKKEENTFRKICFEIHFEGRGEALDPPLQILVCLYANNSTIIIQDHVRPHMLLLERGGHQLSFGDDNDNDNDTKTMTGENYLPPSPFKSKVQLGQVCAGQPLLFSSILQISVEMITFALFCNFFGLNL